MKRKNDNGISWLEFDSLTDLVNLRHGIFLRHGGKSRAPYSTLNMGYNIGDDEEAVTRNRQMIREIIAGIGLEPPLYHGWQVHGTTVEEVTPDSPELTPQCDALVTDHLQTPLFIKHADCQATILYDPVNHAIANVHSGWRGSVANITAAAITKMCDCFGTDAGDLIACVGPSLGPSAAEFINYQEELPEDFWKFRVSDHHLDFWAITKQQLEACGVPSDNIEIAALCTYENSDDFFSYRRDKVTGRHATVVMLT